MPPRLVREAGELSSNRSEMIIMQTDESLRSIWYWYWYSYHSYLAFSLTEYSVHPANVYHAAQTPVKNGRSTACVHGALAAIQASQIGSNFEINSPETGPNNEMIIVTLATGFFYPALSDRMEMQT